MGLDGDLYVGHALTEPGAFTSGKLEAGVGAPAAPAWMNVAGKLSPSRPGRPGLEVPG